MRNVVGAALIAAMFGPTSASAADLAPWGVGVRLGTVMVPGRMPVRLPKAVRDDTNADGEAAIQGARGDLQLGVDAVYYAGDAWRLGLLGNWGFGGKYANGSLLMRYERSIATFSSMDVMFGGGLGVGSTRFRGDDKTRLRVPSYPVRATLSGVTHQSKWAGQLGTFVQYDIPANQYYRGRDGEEIDVNGGLYLSFGVDLTFYIGDFDFK